MLLERSPMHLAALPRAAVRQEAVAEPRQGVGASPASAPVRDETAGFSSKCAGLLDGSGFVNSSCGPFKGTSSTVEA